MNQKTKHMRTTQLALILLTCNIFISLHVSGQQTIYHQYEDNIYWRALDNYNEQKFNLAQTFFEEAYDLNKGEENYIETSSQYYIAMCAIKLFNLDAEYLVSCFVNENPESPLVSDLYFNLANYFYTQKKWKDGMKYFNKLDWDKLTPDQQSEFHFKQGYCLFELGKVEEAKVAFFQLKDKGTKFSSAAGYYYAHIHYDEENYQTALNGFLKLSDDKYFGAIVPYYIVQIYYKQEKYKEITNYVPGIIDNVTEKRLAEVSRITAEAFYYEEKYANAIPYFKKYQKNAKSVTKEDKYQMAYSYYKADSLQSAADMFSSISTSESNIGQNASYYLADCYLKMDDKANARKAFASASRKDFDKEIKEDALFNYAILCYEQPNDPFNEAIHAFEEYIQLYADKKRSEDASRFLVQAYLNTKNYTKALESIEKMPIDNNELKKAYLRIAYYRGVELFNNLRFKEASELFGKAAKYGNYDKLLYTQTLYWNAEANYRLGNYDRAIALYKEFKNSSVMHLVNNYELADYNIGYCYFQKNDFSNAATWLKKFTGKAESTHKDELADAYSRIADAYYMQSEYVQGTNYYQHSIEAGVTNVDYAILHKGICQGLAGNNQAKIETLNGLISQHPSSSYADDASYEKAQAYLNLQNTQKAIENLEFLTTKYTNSELRGNSMVQAGLLYFNLNQNNKAISVLQAAVKEYPNTKTARDALTGLKNVYVDMHQVQGYTDFIASLGSEGPKISINEQDSLVYISAENLYMTGKCEESTPAFIHYIEKFTEGSFLLNAHFYKADCQYQDKNYSEALKSFEYVLKTPSNVFTTQAYLGAGRCCMQIKDYEKAIKNYSSLIELNTSPGNIQEAHVAIMRSNYYLKEYKKAVESAKIVIGLPKSSPEIKRNAQFIVAKSYQELGRDALALEEYKELSKEIMSIEGAEAKFRVAELQYKEKNYDDAEKTILEFSEQSTPHEYWIARSFILWSEIFHQRDDDFQAIETIQSIIDYYENMEDGILDMAKAKKQTYLKEQTEDETPVESQEMEVNI